MRPLPGTAESAAARDPLVRDWAIVAGGSWARLALGLASSVLIARALGPADFGLFVSLGVIATVVGVGADFGLTDAGVRRIAADWPGRAPALRAHARAFFWLRIGVTAISVAIATVAAIPLVPLLLGRPVDAPLVVLALVGVFATALSGTASALLQATGRFDRISVAVLTNAVLTTLLALVLSVAGQLTIASAIVVLGIGTSLASFTVAVRALPKEVRPGWPFAGELVAEARALLGFGLWIWGGRTITIVAASLDLFLVNRWVAPAAVGAYALALNLTAKVDVINQSLYTVLLPTTSSLGRTHDLARFTRGTLGRNVVVALALLALVPLAGPFIALFYGPQFEPAAGLFALLLVVVVLDLFSTPLVLLAQTIGRVRYVALADAIRIVALGASAVQLVPSAGVTGAAIARIIGRAAGAAVLAAVAWRQARMHA